MIRRVFLGLFAGAICASALFAEDAGTIRKDAGRLNVPIYRVAITSPDADTANLAKRAFGTHGSFRLSTPSQAQFIFDFAPAGANSVKLTIKGGTIYEQVFSGSNNVEALMKACDAAVMKTIRTPGYFAGKIVFSYSKNGGQTSEICTSDIVFRNVRALTRDGNDSLMPHFSPDGTKIIYTGYYRTGFMDLLLIDLNTNTRKVFAAYKGSNTGGSFSPDGTRVATILTSTGNAEVWTASAKGGGFKRITNTSATESTPSFSPDGRTLIFAGDYRGAPQIYTAPVSGGKPSVVRTNISGYCSEPVWNKVNPDLIAFTIAQGKGFQVAVYNFRTKQTKVVSRGASTSGPKWLNDGRHIICTKSNGVNRQLYIIDTETDSQKPLHTTSFGSAKEPDFVYTAR